MSDAEQTGTEGEMVYVEDLPKRIFGNVLIDGPDGQCTHMYSGIEERCPKDAVAFTRFQRSRVEMCAEHAREDVPEPPTTEQKELVTDGGQTSPGKHRCRNCGQRFDRPTEGGLPACPEGAVHVAEADERPADPSVWTRLRDAVTASRVAHVGAAATVSVAVVVLMAHTGTAGTREVASSDIEAYELLPPAWFLELGGTALLLVALVATAWLHAMYSGGGES